MVYEVSEAARSCKRLLQQLLLQSASGGIGTRPPCQSRASLLASDSSAAGRTASPQGFDGATFKFDEVGEYTFFEAEGYRVRPLAAARRARCHAGGALRSASLGGPPPQASLWLPC